jgi:hypothetical protein
MIYIITSNRKKSPLETPIVGVEVVVSNLYSLQPELLARRGYDVQPGDILILNDVGVRYNDTRKFIAERHLTVYRADTIEALEDAIFKIRAKHDASKYLADLNEQ